MQELRNAELKEKRAEVTAHTPCVEEPCSVELNKEPEDETTEQPHGTQINIIYYNISHCNIYIYIFFKL